MASAKSKTLSVPPVRPAEGAFRELIRVLGLMERIMQPYFAQFGISGSQWGVLRILHRAQQEGLPGLRLTDLSERLLIRPPSVSGVIDRLERAGLVVRDGSPTDLRAKQVMLTQRGRELVQRVLVLHGDRINALLGGLSGAEQNELNRLLGQLGHHLEGVLARGLSAVVG